jgi:hypothetical protein
LTLFKSGEDATKIKAHKEGHNREAAFKSVRGLRFIENPWGRRAREFVKTTKQMNSTHWEAIMEHASSHLSAPVLDTDEEDNDEDGNEGLLLNPRALIDLDW